MNWPVTKSKRSTERLTKPSKVAKLQKELELEEAEDAFVLKKLADELTREDKDVLRALRKEYRLKHRKVPKRPGAGVAAPGAVAVAAEVQEVG